MGREKKLKTVELVRPTYQPSSAEMNESFSVRKADGSDPTLEDLTKAILQPAKFRFVKKPRSRRR